MIATAVFLAITFMGAFSDIRVVAGTITAVVILAMQGLNLWKTLSTDKVVRHNSMALHKLNGTVDGDIRKQLETLKATSQQIKESVTHTDLTIAHLEKLIERRTSTEPNPNYQGDRDRRLTQRREPPKTVEPIHDPRAGIWPIGLGDSP